MIYQCRLPTRIVSARQGVLAKASTDSGSKTVVNFVGDFEKAAIHVIPKSRWEKGIPSLMGGHLMASGTIAPTSTSTGEGQGEPHQFQYGATDTNVQVMQFSTSDKASDALGKLVLRAAEAAIKSKGSFAIALSGGSLIKSLSTILKQENVTDFSKWHVFWADERNVALDSPDSNYLGAKQEFLDAAGIPSQQIYTLTPGLSVEQAATAYEAAMLQLSNTVLPVKDGFPVLDMTLLGVGPDGHVASLFPNSPQLSEQKKWVLGINDSPKPPPERITLTLPVINASANVIVVALGSGKAEIVQRVLEVQSLPGALPAQIVRPTSGPLYWLLDGDSASQLSEIDWQEKKDFPRNTLA